MGETPGGGNWWTVRQEAVRKYHGKVEEEDGKDGGVGSRGVSGSMVTGEGVGFGMEW